jgi:outer membrane protein assembly factor BamB
MKSLIRYCAIFVFTAATVTSLWANDWPQWRGPNRDGISQETGLLQQWPEGGPKLVWHVTSAGYGFSTPAVVAERLYLLGNEGITNEFVQALSVKDGQTVWRTRLGNSGPNRGPQYPGARSTPTVDGAVLYALGSDGDLACVDLASGHVRWAKNLRTDFGGRPGNWAYAESPLVDGDRVVCTPGGSESTLIALNKNTGDVLWKSAVPGGDEAAYASIIIVDFGGLKQYVQFLQKGLVGVGASTGKFLWRYDQTAKGSPANIPTPVAADGYVYSGASLSGGGIIHLKVQDGAVQVEPIVFTPKLPTSIGGAVKIGDNLYGTTGQAMLCVEFTTGKLKWDERALGAASVCFADGRLYLHGENGEVALVEARPDGYHQDGRFTPSNPPDRGSAKAWAYPVVANGRLYIRDLGSIWAFDLKAR